MTDLIHMQRRSKNPHYASEANQLRFKLGFILGGIMGAAIGVWLTLGLAV